MDVVHDTYLLPNDHLVTSAERINGLDDGGQAFRLNAGFGFRRKC